MLLRILVRMLRKLLLHAVASPISLLILQFWCNLSANQMRLHWNFWLELIFTDQYEFEFKINNDDGDDDGNVELWHIFVMRCQNLQNRYQYSNIIHIIDFSMLNENRTNSFSCEWELSWWFFSCCLRCQVEHKRSSCFVATCWQMF